MKMLLDQYWINKIHFKIFAIFECAYYKITKKNTKKRKFDYYVNKEKLENKQAQELKIMSEEYICILKGALVYF